MVIAYLTRKFYECGIHEDARFIETIAKMLKNSNGLLLTDMQTRQMRQFFNGDIVSTETGEVAVASKLAALLDKSKLEEFKSHFGFYQIVIPEINMYPIEVIGKYHTLSRTEDQFRAIKSNLETRPVYVCKRSYLFKHI